MTAIIAFGWALGTILMALRMPAFLALSLLVVLTIW